MAVSAESAQAREPRDAADRSFMLKDGAVAHQAADQTIGRVALAAAGTAERSPRPAPAAPARDEPAPAGTTVGTAAGTTVGTTVGTAADTAARQPARRSARQPA